MYFLMILSPYRLKYLITLTKNNLIFKKISEIIKIVIDKLLIMVYNIPKWYSWEMEVTL